MFKKNSALLLLLVTSLVAQAQKNNFVIQGKFSNWTRGPVVLLYQANNELVQDTVEVTNGSFTFRGSLSQPRQVGIYSIAAEAGKTKDNISFYIDHGKTVLTGKDSLTQASIKGSTLTAEGLQLQKQVAPYHKKLVDLRMKAMAIQGETDKKEELDSIGKQYKVLIDSIKTLKVNFIKQHPNSFLSISTLNEYIVGAIDYNFIHPLFENLSPDLKNTPLAKEMAHKLAIAKRTGLGERLPDFTSKDTLRTPIVLSEVVKKGKVTLIDFWASWCIPCRKENPNVVKAYQAFHDKGFNILGVSLDKSESAWKKAIVQDGLDWYHVSSLQYWDEPAAKLYGITGVPDNFLVDSEGKVLARGLRAEALYQKLQELLN